ncbi:hypothetical protein BTJ39_23385 [Izhakiella australiensis]|uniref:Uncharacterized protein n=1 Tax=Izhakiella australiensis TaxID=1926881 RepID=A0A1S8Y6J0_9GAMM|nr:MULTISPECIES: hypothetical protein [Erwiniaceae]OON34711.1 hypothetical protein BTJ39_23385 [Izhakiella australiensis]PIJ50045.1 hypothetical protein BV501_10495 [Erwinia sp. OAMSP11]PIJ72409.1 hypothetical protein BK416_09300 [Erwinia sp. OLSSP12]PIJ80032.1 hypothetical protein BLD47_11870 [Erwinia sp. OLCASP19]PIJ82170.1 hypothetical protein BLD46_11865 [Erwinia sp. OLMTSP26]
MTKERFLAEVMTGDRIWRSGSFDAFLKGFSDNLPGIDNIMLTCYRAGQAVTELVFSSGGNVKLYLTIREGKISLTRLLPEHIRLSALEISLPDVVDILILTTVLARHYGLTPELADDAGTSTVLMFARPFRKKRRSS